MSLIVTFILIIILIIIIRILYKLYMTSYHVNNILPSKKKMTNPTQYISDVKEATRYFALNSPKIIRNYLLKNIKNFQKE